MSRISAGGAHGHRLYLSIPAGLLAIVGAGGLVVGASRPLVPGGQSLRSAITWPSIWAVVALAAVTGLAGVFAILGGRSLVARLATSALVVPGFATAGLLGGWMQTTHGDTVREGGVAALALGGLLVTAGVLAIGVAALLGLVQLAVAHAGTAGWGAALLGLLTAAGLAQLWLLGSLTWNGASMLAGSELVEITARDDVGWSGVTVLGAVIAIVVAVAQASARRGGAAAGIALGAAVVAAVELGIRKLGGVPDATKLVENPGSAVSLRTESLIAAAATVVLALLLMVAVRGRDGAGGDWEPATDGADDDAAGSTDWDSERQWAYQPD